MRIKKGWLWGIVGLAGVVAIGLFSTGITLYSWIYRPSLIYTDKDTLLFHVRSDEGFDQVYKNLSNSGWFRSDRGLLWVAEKKRYSELVKPGRYTFERGMSNTEVIDLLRSGRQTEVNLVFNTTRTFERIAGVVGRQIEPDSLEILELLTDQAVYEELGFPWEQRFALFIPDTYRLFWTATPREFIDRMKIEYDRFWNDARKTRAAEIGLTPFDVVTIASIVQEETVKVDEMASVAGVYMNRIKRGMRLQADPTVIFALQDPTIRRVLHRHLKVDSPYNTYRIKGLPPGPIRIPSREAIEASLNYESHRYLYFCAREDFSGYHAFAEDYREHLQNARRYQRALEKR